MESLLKMQIMAHRTAFITLSENLIRNLVRLLLLLVASVTLSSPAYALSYTITDLGTFGGLTSNAEDISDNGEVVGNATTTDRRPYAFLYSNDMMTFLGDFGGGGSGGLGINENGQVVGYAKTGPKDYHAFLI